MKKLIDKLISGGDTRISRFHTEDNQLVPWKQALAETPMVVIEKAKTIATGRRSPKPWWPIKAIDITEALLSPKSRVLEFGSGSSTIWLSRRSAAVFSLEEDKVWFQVTHERLQHEGILNASVLHRHGESYYDIPIEWGSFDFVVIDGGWRWKCVEAAIPRMNPGGIIYLDNADSDKDKLNYIRPSDCRLAQAAIEQFCTAHPEAFIKKVIGMIHGELYAGEGWFLHLPPTG